MFRHLLTYLFIYLLSIYLFIYLIPVYLLPFYLLIYLLTVYLFTYLLCYLLFTYLFLYLHLTTTPFSPTLEYFCTIDNGKTTWSVYDGIVIHCAVPTSFKHHPILTGYYIEKLHTVYLHLYKPML